MIDLHCHVLAGIDDGPSRSEDSVALCRASEALGVDTIVATPHVSWEYPNHSADIAARVAALNDELRAQGVGVKVLPGAEVAISKAIELDDGELRALTLANGGWLLAEPPFTPGAASAVDTMIHQLRARGHRLLLAHPERCPAYLRDRAALERIAADGVLLSITAGALVGRFGKLSMRFADGLLRDGLAHNVASDAHNVSRRAPGMARELRDAGFESQADWLCRAVPEALIAGQVPPARPEPVRRSGGLARLFRA